MDKRTSRREFIKQSSLAAVIAAGMGSLAWVEMGHSHADQAVEGTGDLVPKVVANAQKADTATAELVNTPDKVDPKVLATILQRDDTAPENQVPYISYYYIEPKVNVGAQATIDYYVTDYWQKDYVQDDDSERFTVDYWVNGSKSTINNVKAGENSLALPKLPKGKVLFAIQCTDSKGRESHRLYQEFLSVDPKEEEIPPNKVYAVDLNKFNISNNDTNPEATSAGLTAMLTWASEQGYRKAVLPKGTYRLSEKVTVKMATQNLTLDMNGSKFKLNPSASSNVLMFMIADAYDSHVINGEFEGDLKDHDFSKDPYNEHVHAISLGGWTEYCTFKDIYIHDVVGYGSSTEMNGSTRGVTTVLADVNGFQPGDIDNTGKDVGSSQRSTTKELADISKFADGVGFFQMGVYLGYQGNPAGRWPFRVHFYDADKKYLETIPAFMYRRVYIPQNAKFVKITIFNTSTPNPAIFDFHHPYNCAFLNIRHEDIRCVGMAPAGFTNLLVDNCTFDNCGWELAKCAFDSEDGWDMQQDLTFRNNIFGAKKENRFNEFVTPDGVDYVVENNVMSTMIYDNTKSSVFRNNKFKKGAFVFGQHDGTLYPRTYNNTFSGMVTIELGRTPLNRVYLFKDSVFSAGVFYKDKTDTVQLIRCKLAKAKVQNWDSFSTEFKKLYLNVNEFDLTKDWKFLDDPAIGKNVADPKFDDKGWKTIDATLQWQLQGLPEYHNTGWYRKTVNLPKEAAAQTTVIFFSGSDGSAEVFVNGTKVGEHLLGEGFSGWDETFEMDISKNLVPGNNVIAVKVQSKSQDTAAGLTGGVHIITGKRTFQ
ncbi:MAG: sugar-binding domain-containing protein [Abditibacteriaceae bacterium]